MVILKRSLCGSFLAISAALLLACGGGGGTPTPETPDPALPDDDDIANNLIDSGANNYSNYQIKMDASGNGIAIWTENDGTITNIMSNRYDASTGWATPEAIEDYADDSLSIPDLDMNANGDAIVAWGQGNGTYDKELWGRRYSASSGWNSPELISNDTGDAFNLFSPDVSINENGDVLVIWEQINASATEAAIWAKMFSATSGWDSSQSLYATSDVFGIYSSDADLADNGDAALIWVYANNRIGGVQALVSSRNYTSSGGWGVNNSLDNFETAEYSFSGLGLEIAPDGQVLTYWARSQITAATDLIRGSHYTTLTGWETAYDIHDNFTPFGRSLATDSFGNGILLWTELDTTGSGTAHIVRGKRFTTGVGWGDAENISDGVTSAIFPSIHSDPTDTNGSMTAIWTQAFDNTGSSGDRPISRYFTISNGWDDPLPLNNNPMTIGRTKIAMVPNSSGDAMAIWSTPSSTPIELTSGYISR